MVETLVVLAIAFGVGLLLAARWSRSERRFDSLSERPPAPPPPAP